MYAAIKINSQQEYKEAEKLLMEKGFKSDKKWSESIYKIMTKNNYQHFIIVNYDRFGLYNHNGNAKVFENINEFLETLTNH